MMHPWILKSGTCDEHALQNQITEYVQKQPAMMLAGCTDCFISGEAFSGQWPEIDFPHLLELRVFRADNELWAHRSCIGMPFSFRIADEATLKANIQNESSTFLSSPEHYRLERIHRLDMDESASSGGRIHSLGGGYYSLSITDENTVRVVVYLEYDKNGIAHSTDVRMKCFERKGWDE